MTVNKLKVTAMLYMALAVLCAAVACSDDDENVVQQTGWRAPSSANYQYSMTYVSQLAFGSAKPNLNPNTELAAFLFGTNECRGFATLTLSDDAARAVAYLTVYSNSISGDSIVLRAWDADSRRLYEHCAAFGFRKDASLGKADTVMVCKP